MLRYKTKTRPGLVALYDIRPGNGAGPFLQPRSPHGARSKGQRDPVLQRAAVTTIVENHTSRLGRFFNHRSKQHDQPY